MRFVRKKFRKALIFVVPCIPGEMRWGHSFISSKTAVRISAENSAARCLGLVPPVATGVHGRDASDTLFEPMKECPVREKKMPDCRAKQTAKTNARPSFLENKKHQIVLSALLFENITSGIMTVLLFVVLPRVYKCPQP